jgi:hypothetical protein
MQLGGGMSAGHLAAPICAFAWEEGSASATWALFPLPRSGSEGGVVDGRR